MSIVEIHKGMVAELSRWLETEGLLTCLNENERGLLAIPLGRWQPDLIEAVGWLVEPLGVFAWAVSLIKTLPPYDRRFSSEDLLIRLRLGKPLRIPDLLRLRSMEELQAALHTAQQWESRSTMASRPPGPGRPAPEVGPPAVGQAANGRTNGLQPGPAGRQIPASDRPRASLSPQQAELLRAISEQRAAALRWLCGR